MNEIIIKTVFLEMGISVIQISDSEVVLGLTIWAASFLVGIFLIFAVIEWLWGKGFGLVKPRPVLIYENQPWWVEDIGLVLFFTFLFTVVSAGSTWLFFPVAISEILSWILLFWILSFIAIVCGMYGEKQKRSESNQSTAGSHR